jgi:hypothetical protein
MSLYSHPATSGACELPCVEAALTEKIITTAPYSFGEDIIENNKGSIPMKFTFYTEHGTQFLKSQPSAYELSKIFKKVFEMKPQVRFKMEQDSRKWALENYGIEVNGKKIEEFIDTFEILDDSVFEFESEPSKKQNPFAIIEDNADNKLWVKSLYKLILDSDVTDQDEGLIHWLQRLEQNIPKEQIENYFREVAKQEVEKQNVKTIEIKDLFNEFKDYKKVLIVQPESIGDIFLVTSLLESLRSRYPSNKYKIYFATKPEYQDLINGNPFVDKWVPYHPIMDNVILMEGGMGQKGICDIVYSPYFSTQRLLSYMHNGEDKIDLELK